MKTNIEYCDPFDGEPENFWMKIEHCGRYLWAAERLSGEGCQSVADIACATGYGSRILSEKINQVIGIDRSTDYIERARRSTREGHIRYLCLDLDQSQLAQKLSDIDAVVCFETLEHLQHPLKALQEFHQCLRAKGLLLLSVPNERYEQLDENGQNLDPFHLHIFSPDDVKNLWNRRGFPSWRLSDRISATGSSPGSQSRTRRAFSPKNRPKKCGPTMRPASGCFPGFSAARTPKIRRNRILISMYAEKGVAIICL